ncbi:MBL fold metallo-hydrolase [Streptacidiphilus sp. EB129]|uniref:MBL fold metallo-hydrolase n=1 Tax=Streptacidiphilus sp. EB129 TaxID=3156262 RepID=UPI003517F14D
MEPAGRENGLIDFVTAAPVAGADEPAWIHGSPSRRHSSDPPIQVHAHDRHTFLLRQSQSVNYEGPFVFLFLGNERALLLDTGATADPERFPLRRTVDGIVADWLVEHPRTDYRLVVAHTHGHGDHIAGDPQFADRPGTTVVGVDAASVAEFYGFRTWPEEVVGFDLGGRVLELTGIPGHEDSSIAVYDPWSGFLLTGDTVYPGRLYTTDFPAFVTSLDRLVEFAGARTVTRVLGCHIEMTRTPGRDYPTGSVYQPDEPPLQLTTDQLVAVRDAARAAVGRPGVHRGDTFVIWNGPCHVEQGRQLVRAITGRLRDRLRRSGGR